MDVPGVCYGLLSVVMVMICVYVVYSVVADDLDHDEYGLSFGSDCWYPTHTAARLHFWGASSAQA